MTDSLPQQRHEGAPRPEPLRFFGTTWVDRDGGYTLRRAGVTLVALAAAVTGALLLRFGYQGLAIAEVGGVISALVVVMFAACSALAFRSTWKGFTRRPEPNADPAAARSLQSIKTIGFIGTLLAWFIRSLSEAPGEKLRRTEYERESELYERRRAARTGNPAARAAKKRSGKAGKRR
ncbi:MAG TPA: hypothetical protein DEQ61_17850 [Streptomyces sp.]|nr:hypothetical protein [Streptomyces sp.]